MRHDTRIYFSMTTLLGLSMFAITSVCADPDPLDVFKKDSDRSFEDLAKVKREARKKREEERKEADEIERLRRKDDQSDDQAADTVMRNKWVEDFTDGQYGQHDFSDLRNLDGSNVLMGSRDWLRKSDDKDDRKDVGRDDDDKRDDTADVLKEYKRERKLEDKRAMFEVENSGLPNLHDWVPSDPDPVANGAFALGADNGSPVPYKLNGWVEIQRKLPWAEAD